MSCYQLAVRGASLGAVLLQVHGGAFWWSHQIHSSVCLHPMWILGHTARFLSAFTVLFLSGAGGCCAHHAACWVLACWARGQTSAPGSGSAESWPLALQGSPRFTIVCVCRLCCLCVWNVKCTHSSFSMESTGSCC